MEPSKITRRIETKRVATLGVRLENAGQVWKSDAHRARHRFKRPDPAGGPRSGSRHLHDQPSAADYSRSDLNLWWQASRLHSQKLLKRIDDQTSTPAS